MMSDIYIVIGPGLLTAAVCLAFLAGFVKGTVGFALPMIMISGLGSPPKPQNPKTPIQILVRMKPRKRTRYKSDRVSMV